MKTKEIQDAIRKSGRTQSDWIREALIIAARKKTRSGLELHLTEPGPISVSAFAFHPSTSAETRLARGSLNHSARHQPS
jgi:hypothetical protein